MKYIFIVLVLHICATPLYTKTDSLLRNRTVQRNCKKQLDELLEAIGVSTVPEALQRVQQLPELLEKFGAFSASQAVTIVPKKGTQAEVAKLLRIANVSTVPQIIQTIDGLPNVLQLLQANTLKDAQKKIVVLFDERTMLQRQVATYQTNEMQFKKRETQFKMNEAQFKKDEARYIATITDLKARYTNLTRQCKKIEKELNTIGALFA